MNKKMVAALLAAALAVTAAPAAFADYDNNYGYDYNNYDYNNYDYNNYDYNNYDYDNGYDNGETTTTAPVPDYDPAETAGNEVTSMENKSTTLVPDKPTSQPSRVYLQPGEFSTVDLIPVELRIEADATVSNALISVSFDTSMLKLEKTELNPEVGGKAAENSFNGKYVLNYTNESGSNFKGKYSTLYFKLLDKDMVSTTVFLSVTTLDNKTGIPISYSAENGIIQNPDAPAAQLVDSEPVKQNKQVTLLLSKGQATPDELGISDFRNIVVADPAVVSYDEGVIKILAVGQTTFDVVFNNNELETYDVVVMDDTVVTEAEEAAAPVVSEPEPVDHSGRNLFIIIAVAVAVVVLIIEYLVIMRPVGKSKRKLAAAERFFENEEAEEDEEDVEMRADLQKAFAARDARRKAAVESDKGSDDGEPKDNSGADEQISAEKDKAEEGSNEGSED